MEQIFHSVTLDIEKCKGCTTCIKRCPVEAIRVHDGKAKIMKERCIDCGECIRSCPNHAKIAVTDTLEKLAEYTYTIALPAPSFFGQFKERENVDTILHAFIDLGFNEVFEVALAAEIVATIVRQKLMDKSRKKPLFSSACPAILRLMQTKYPDLLDQVIPVLTPMEVAARFAKESASARTKIAYDEIGAFFISPCPAKVTEVRNPMMTEHSAVNGIIGANVIYKDLVKCIANSKKKNSHDDRSMQKATRLGMAWGYLTGESKNIDCGVSLAVSGIRNVMSLLEEVERGELKDVDFIEVQACTAGCVGGPLNIQNSFVGRVRLKDLILRCGSVPAYFDEKAFKDMYEEGRYQSIKPLVPRAPVPLDADVEQALIKMERLDKLAAELPGLDCGACGSPNCRALAEDIICGNAFETDCVIKLRERVKSLAEEILDLARIVPPVMADTSKDGGRKE